MQKYLDGVHMVHILIWVELPAMADKEVSITMMGPNKTMLTLIRLAHPLTQDILLDIEHFLDLTK